MIFLENFTFNIYIRIAVTTHVHVCTKNIVWKKILCMYLAQV